MNTGFGSASRALSPAEDMVLALLPAYVEWLVKGLAAVGGAAIGWLVVGLIVRRVSRLVGDRGVPGVILTGVRAAGALAFGLAVWMMVFAPGGSGLFGGGGSLTGEVGTGAAPATSRNSQAPSRAALPPSQSGKTVRVTLLGGSRVKDARFYLVDGEEQPLTLAELKSKIKERQAAGAHIVELLIYENSVARNHPAVQELEQWAGQNELTVSVPPTHGEIP